MQNYSPKSTWTRRNCIGKGSFGVVSLAVDQSENNFTFAVKSVNQNSGEFLRCLENEIRILKSLSSPYIVTYLGDDVTWEDSTVYRNLHMEYMRFGTVADVAGRCDLFNLRSYTRCVTAALSYIHAENLVHCDVKGANVLIGEVSGTAKLADFGSAVELNGKFPVTRGSPLWMAPEVVRGEYIGPESDVWSLGCTVIEMLTGKPPWQDTVAGIDTLLRIGYSDDLPELPVPVPEDLEDFLKKCLKRDRSERWSCDQLLRHPFLFSCPSPLPPHIKVNDCKLSPRCVFDWSDASSSSSSSNESTVDVCDYELNAKQRISKLASNTRVNWESEGWEVVRHVTVTGSEASVSGGVNWEDTECDESCSYDYESTTGDAPGTMVGGDCRYVVGMYRCKMFVWIKKLFPIYFLINWNVFQHVYYTKWLTSTPSLFWKFNLTLNEKEFTWLTNITRVS